MTLARRIDTLRMRLRPRLRLPCARTVLVVGDSLCGGRAPAMLAGMLHQSGRMLGVRAVWRPGIGLRELPRLLEAEAARKPHSVSVVIVLAGTNEAKRTRLPTEFQPAVIEACPRLILATWPASFAVLCTVPLPGKHPALRPDATEIIARIVNPAIRQAATRSAVVLCELEDVFADRVAYRTDGVHPSIEGDRVLAGRWYEAILPRIPVDHDHALSPQLREDSCR